MSKALLKKSLAFVKSGNEKSESWKRADEVGVKKNCQVNARKPSSLQRKSTSTTLTATEGDSTFLYMYISCAVIKEFFIHSAISKKLLYFTKRKRIKLKVIKTVSYYGLS